MAEVGPGLTPQQLAATVAVAGKPGPNRGTGQQPGLFQGIEQPAGSPASPVNAIFPNAGMGASQLVPRRSARNTFQQRQARRKTP